MLEKLYYDVILLVQERNELRRIKANTTEIELKLDCYPSHVVLSAIEYLEKMEVIR